MSGGDHNGLAPLLAARALDLSLALTTPLIHVHAMTMRQMVRLWKMLIVRSKRRG